MLMKTYLKGGIRTETVRVFRGGVQTEELPAPVIMDGRLYAPEVVFEDTMASVDQAIELVARIAPWVKLVMAPSVWSPFCWRDDDGFPSNWVAKTKNDAGLVETWERLGGQFVPAHNLVAVSYGRKSPGMMVSDALHEAFHAVDHVMPARDRAILDAGLSEGLCPGLEGPGRYHTRPSERRARAFEAWCGPYIEGFGRLCLGRDHEYAHPTFDEIMHEVYTGKMAERIMSNAEAA